MVQWFLLYRVDTEPARAPIACQNDLILKPTSQETQTTLALAKPAGARAHVALDAPVVNNVPVLRGNCGAFPRHLPALADGPNPGARYAVCRAIEPLLAFSGLTGDELSDGPRAAAWACQPDELTIGRQ